MKSLIKLGLSVGLISGMAMMASTASAEDCSVTITGNDAMQFSTKEIPVNKACEQFTINLEHVGKLPKNVMGHNVVIAKADDVAAVARDAIKAGLDADYLTKDDARILAASSLVGGGEKTSVTFDVSKLEEGQNYNYFCSFPGHSAIMKGVIKLVE